ncbi:chromate efflux transporter [Sphingobium sp. DEHP117]|uniref:chromate efflux transporter n=1 Tax=Sphingobium sp. DEHP117 TaxID=2993436 RepID=UPI0027D5E8C3|nr:chromate efflux transporter [Sphingobium sp. DEHP117]MDQ4421819.1 chromate efflux transporter [Sphingobium sp. DEHP117]
MENPSFRDMVRLFGRIGCLSFGGPAGQIALMHKELVAERQWIGEEQFLRALNFCHLLPGPEAQQLATWIGWRLHGVRGGLAAGSLFVLPGAAVMLALSIIYVLASGVGWVFALFLGVKAAVLALVVQAVLRIAGRALTTPFKRILAVASFIAVFFFNLPFPVVVLGAGAIGMIIAAWRPEWLALKVASEGGGASAPTRVSGTMRIAAILIGAWALPFVAIALTVGPDHVLMQIAAFFSRLAVVTFGGAYAVLAYMAQEAVQTYHWLRPGEMADGLGLAETTPGPLIMVTQFVGFLGAYRLPEPFSPLVAGMLGALVTTWVTFVPCFLWIFTFASWIERLEHAKRLQGGLAALTAAVVGVIANVALWFGVHVLFWRVGLVRYGPLRFIVPDVHSPNLTAMVLAALAFGLLFVGRIGVVAMLCLCGMAALMLRVFMHM